MTRDRVQSSSIASVGYDPATRVLEVEFVDGRVHRHEGVDAGTYGALMGADSIGSHYHANLKGRYAPKDES